MDAVEKMERRQESINSQTTSFVELWPGARLRTGHSVNLAVLIVPIVHRCALAINARGALDAGQAWLGLKGTDRRGRL